MFKNNIAIHGKHAYYMTELDKNRIFNRLLDIYVNAPVVGFFYNRKGVEDKSVPHQDLKKSIFTEQINQEEETLKFIFRLIMLLENSKEINLDERVTRAFRDDSLKNESHKQNMKLFHSYVLGGIEVLYEKIIEKGATEQDYIKNAYEFMKEQNLAFNHKSADEILKEL